MLRDVGKQKCYLENIIVSVADYRLKQNNIVSFSCKKGDSRYNNLYWDGAADQINGGFSPNNDALYAGQVINALYTTWYHVPALVKHKKPMRMYMVTHSPNITTGPDGKKTSDPDNAYWDGDKERMYFGDGRDFFYPLTSLSVAAHEISHGFTEQHSDLVYYGESGGMNESFSDMAAKTAEYYLSKHNNLDWSMGAEIVKIDDMGALRYMDLPSKDCEFLHQNGSMDCSIDEYSDYKQDLDVHFSSGLYNRAFYLLSTTPNWNPEKAFAVMVQANEHHWVSVNKFCQGLGGVLDAAKDFGYDTQAVTDAFAKVGIYYPCSV